MAAPATVEIQHPTLENVRQTIPRSALDAWTEQGWIRVKQAERSDVEPPA